MDCLLLQYRLPSSYLNSNNIPNDYDCSRSESFLSYFTQETLPYLNDHCLSPVSAGGIDDNNHNSIIPVFPGASMVTMLIIAISKSLLDKQSATYIKSLEIVSPIYIPIKSACTCVQVTLDYSNYKVSIRSTDKSVVIDDKSPSTINLNQDYNWAVNATGQLSSHPFDKTLWEWSRTIEEIEDKCNQYSADLPTSVKQSNQLYEDEYQRLGLKYGPAFRFVTESKTCFSDCYAKLHWPTSLRDTDPEYSSRPYNNFVHPAYLDGIFHSAFGLFDLNGLDFLTHPSLCIPTKLNNFKIFKPIVWGNDYTVFHKKIPGNSTQLEDKEKLTFSDSICVIDSTTREIVLTLDELQCIQQFSAHNSSGIKQINKLISKSTSQLRWCRISPLNPPNNDSTRKQYWLFVEDKSLISVELARIVQSRFDGNVKSIFVNIAFDHSIDDKATNEFQLTSSSACTCGIVNTNNNNSCICVGTRYSLKLQYGSDLAESEHVNSIKQALIKFLKSLKYQNINIEKIIHLGALDCYEIMRQDQYASISLASSELLFNVLAHFTTLSYYGLLQAYSVMYEAELNKPQVWIVSSGAVSDLAVKQQSAQTHTIINSPTTSSKDESNLAILHQCIGTVITRDAQNSSFFTVDIDFSKFSDLNQLNLLTDLFLTENQWYEVNDNNIVTQTNYLIQEFTLRDGALYSRNVQPINITVPPLPSQFPSDNASTSGIITDPSAVYIITGGFGALGLSTALLLYLYGARNICLVGRGGRPSMTANKLIHIFETLNRLINLILIQADVSSYDGCYLIIQTLTSSGFEIRGIFHSAGRSYEQKVIKENAIEYSQAMKTTVLSVWYLHNLSFQYRLNLDYFICYSRKASLPGVVSSSVANFLMDNLMSLRVSMGLKGFSLNIGPINSLGMFGKLDACQNEFGNGPAAKFLSINRALWTLSASLNYNLTNMNTSSSVIIFDLDSDSKVFAQYSSTENKPFLLKGILKKEVQNRRNSYNNDKSKATSIDPDKHTLKQKSNITQYSVGGNINNNAFHVTSQLLATIQMILNRNNAISNTAPGDNVNTLGMLSSLLPSQQNFRTSDTQFQLQENIIANSMENSKKQSFDFNEQTVTDNYENEEIGNDNFSQHLVEENNSSLIHYEDSHLRDQVSSTSMNEMVNSYCPSSEWEEWDYWVSKEDRIESKFAGNDFVLQNHCFQIKYFKHRTSDVLRGFVKFDLSCEGTPGKVHGGAIGAVCDSIVILTALSCQHENSGVTKSLDIQFKRPLPLEQICVFESDCTIRSSVPKESIIKIKIYQPGVAFIIRGQAVSTTAVWTVPSNQMASQLNYIRYPNFLAPAGDKNVKLRYQN